ncbi:hypothetical protein PR003_g28481 [Phytophthora rubi]|uniref:GST N-terminal domain-containing protein n=1 Tax=Phytophthora rubi TaxID=129364 RepID=A0A6A4BZL6_9STRA|nr:hypothetical protein PR002_g27266 [Phytophthora rubi]KAE8970591.1 hypothetical protein PR001_g27158 [Phytophthora rubi]KAE9278571.1 hypothetical protein PR003_g28481 [Phytophthora rubi]
MMCAGYIDFTPTFVLDSYKLLNGTYEEPICLAFFIGGVEFEDERISREALANRKLPFNQLPVLEVDGEVIAQTNHSGALPSARRRRRSSWPCALSWPAA